jgi:hypothetical protein
MIFNHVDYFCYDSQGANRVLEALRKAAQFQIDHSITGLLTYHFSRPKAELPEQFRFIEFYASDKVFWDHSSDYSVQQELMVTFDPDVRKSFSWWAIYSPDVDEKVRQTVSIVNGIEVSPIHCHYSLKPKGAVNGDAIFFVGRIPQDAVTLQTLKDSADVCSKESLYHIVFEADGEIHVTTLWPTPDAVINTFEGLTLPDLAFQYAQLYLGANEQTPQLLDHFKPWNPELRTNPEAGFSLHPKYSKGSHC